MTIDNMTCPFCGNKVREIKVKIRKAYARNWKEYVAIQCDSCDYHVNIGNWNKKFLLAALRESEDRIEQLEEVLKDIGEYTGEGPMGIYWRDIVISLGKKARAALASGKEKKEC